MAGGVLGLLDAAVVRPETTALDLEFLVGSAVRAGAFPTADGTPEARVTEALEAMLVAATDAGDRAAADAVLMAAVELGNSDLAARAAAATATADGWRRAASVPGDGTVLVVTSPLAGGGDRPTFAWASAATAVEYVVAVTDADGAPLWSWRGPATTVPLGAELIMGQDGPRLATTATLTVFALGADGAIVARTAPTAIAA